MDYGYSRCATDAEFFSWSINRLHVASRGGRDWSRAQSNDDGASI
jgi:hypothetical protein